MNECNTEPLVVPDYPNLLAEPSANRAAPALRPLLLVGLLILCLVPRAWISTKCSSICPDATLYINIAKSIENGQWDAGTVSPRMFTYPAILAMMHRVGFGWETGARIWGVVISSLAVLPLFGWIRRQFDDRVALAACFLYAVHPRLVEWTPSIIRDPTFWFLFVLSLYLLWRAISEVRLGLFLPAGVAVTFAALMRTEGFLLIIPFILWSIYRWWFLREDRWRLAVGAGIVFFTFPAILIATSFFDMEGSSGERANRLLAVTHIHKWQQSIASCFSPAPAEPAPAEPPSSIDFEPVPKMSMGMTVWRYARVLVAGGTAIFWSLLMGGIFCWQRVWARGDNQPLFFIALIVMVGIWFDLRFGQVTSNRYPLTVVLLGLPFASLALLGISQWLLDTAKRFGLDKRLQLTAMVFPMILTAAVNFSEISADRYEMWKARAELGHWMREELGRPPMIAGHEGVAKVCNYYCGGDFTSYLFKLRPGSIVKMAKNPDIDFLLLSRGELRAFDPQGLFAELDRLGFERVDPARLPKGTGGILVFELKTAEKRTPAAAAVPQ